MLGRRRTRTATAALLCMLFATNGCVAGPRPRPDDDAYKWIGSWGKPHIVAPLDDGSEVLTWESKYFGSAWQTFICRRNMRVAPDGKTVMQYNEVDCGRWL